MPGIGKGFRRRLTGCNATGTAAIQGFRTASSVLRCTASPRPTLLAESLGMPSLWVITVSLVLAAGNHVGENVEDDAGGLLDQQHVVVDGHPLGARGRGRRWLRSAGRSRLARPGGRVPLRWYWRANPGGRSLRLAKPGGRLRRGPPRRTRRSSWPALGMRRLRGVVFKCDQFGTMSRSPNRRSSLGTYATAVFAGVQSTTRLVSSSSVRRLGWRAPCAIGRFYHMCPSDAMPFMAYPNYLPFSGLLLGIFDRAVTASGRRPRKDIRRTRPFIVSPFPSAQDAWSGPMRQDDCCGGSTMAPDSVSDPRISPIHGATKWRKSLWTASRWETAEGEPASTHDGDDPGYRVRTGFRRSILRRPTASRPSWTGSSLGRSREVGNSEMHPVSSGRCQVTIIWRRTPKQINRVQRLESPTSLGQSSDLPGTINNRDESMGDGSLLDRRAKLNVDCSGTDSSRERAACGPSDN